MPESKTGNLPQVAIGVASETGLRRRNEDFVGASLGPPGPRTRQDLIAAIADGIGGAKGGREAAEIAVGGFLDGYYDQPETLDVQRAAARTLEPLNAWIAKVGRTDALLAGMGCTFTALVLRGRAAHVIHIGDTRLYRLTDERLSRLTQDHTVAGQPNVLYRAMGIEDCLRLDYAMHPLTLHDRFLLCSDGIHGVLPDTRIAEILLRRSAPEDTARLLVEAALAAGSKDNVTALVLDVIGLPPIDSASLSQSIAALPIGAFPRPGDHIDGFVLDKVLADQRVSRLFVARDLLNGGTVVLKFPHPRLATEAEARDAFVREAWVAMRIRSPWVGKVIELAEGRQSQLYAVMPFHDGETLASRLRRIPLVSLEEGRAIAVKLGRAIVDLHRIGIIHRDIKPENVLLERNGSLKLIDLGAARIPGLEDAPIAGVPGTASYMAPELFAGVHGNEGSDLFSFAVTLFQTFTRALPFGEIEPFSHPRHAKPLSLMKLRPDLPAWLEASLSRALALAPTDRHGDVLEFLQDMESGPINRAVVGRRRRPLYQRNPLKFWQFLSIGLGILLLIALQPR